MLGIFRAFLLLRILREQAIELGLLRPIFEQILGFFQQGELDLLRSAPLRPRRIRLADVTLAATSRRRRAAAARGRARQNDRSWPVQPLRNRATRLFQRFVVQPTTNPCALATAKATRPRRARPAPKAAAKRRMQVASCVTGAYRTANRDGSEALLLPASFRAVDQMKPLPCAAPSRRGARERTVGFEAQPRNLMRLVPDGQTSARRGLERRSPARPLLARPRAAPVRLEPSGGASWPNLRTVRQSPHRLPPDRAERAFNLGERVVS